jgi:hypothetical protein
MQAIGMERMNWWCSGVLHCRNAGAGSTSPPPDADGSDCAARRGGDVAAFTGMFIGQAVRSRMQPDVFRRWFLIAMILLDSIWRATRWCGSTAEGQRAPPASARESSR